MKDLRTSFLIVGGSAEARALAARLPGCAVRLTEPDRTRRGWPVPVSLGPLSEDWLAAQGVAAVIEAAHPCDTATAFATQRACAALGLPRLQLVRRGWRAGRGDRWVHLRHAAEAAQVIPRGATVLTAIGRERLGGLRNLDARVYARTLSRVTGGFPLRRGRFLPAEGPFTVAQEARLLRRLEIDWLIVHDAGGPGGWPKLAAARALGLPVALLARPRRPGGPRVTTVNEALDWAGQWLRLDA
ncbi:precorrin-6A/cobalt-precorrin-6A reductase [Salipiger sp. P9]|uniref:precorrin-6A/cobalt-precorrin-6A reductase n=1 Tax=Salipiger pentaromativorans TaxID=2943193 RepID=UPI0021578B33|nr:precorrin-6A/cobalt-precorrin-6A reductase [Salipiger pentaromativorans]MCR8549748.1 precorrin-6A/cobalt-precorrin-6A reductase [Salipiger pentaromativorans]